MDIGRTIKTFRTAAGISQSDLASRVGFSASGLSLIESGAREPSVSFLRAVSRELGIPISLLFVEASDAPENLSPRQAEDYRRVQSLLAEVMKNTLLQKFGGEEERKSGDDRKT